MTHEKTVFGLDYDGTITRDPNMWFEIMRLMQQSGHQVHIVTMRHGVESTMGHAPMEQRFLDGADGVHFTGNMETRDRDAKKPHMDAKGIEVHVWIDDNPKAVHMTSVAVYSILRDWIKGQVTAVETGILTFEGAFLGQILLPNGKTVLEQATESKMLPAPEGPK